ncbi:arsenate reductase ArsC [Desulfovermiculus halophilus]|uniref:arsenate reductase ArsC n=1 Tax=Desulfovermiculus halophilus TaxID=339722 RepID=UPI0004887414|nr:arsenate reductase ArsC [Desulfovermiculus halophilus]
MDKKKVLFLCTGNSCRSQMAEGWARHLLHEQIEAVSAGVIKHGVDSRAIKVMAEAGVDISGQESKTIDELPDQSFDAVITLCDAANESCPFFPGQVIRLHQGFDDPPSLARNAPDEEGALQIYRRVRDEIRDFVLNLPERIEDKSL